MSLGREWKDFKVLMGISRNVQKTHKISFQLFFLSSDNSIYYHFDMKLFERLGGREIVHKWAFEVVCDFGNFSFWMS